MIIKKTHALFLLNGERREEALTSLYLMGLTDSSGNLTESGKSLKKVLESLISSGKISSVDQWDENFRWLSSEVIAMLDAARLGDNIPETTLPHLSRRGFARENNRVLTEEGHEVLKIYKSASPLLYIDGELAEFIRKTASGPARSSFIKEDQDKVDLLEAMRLIAFGIPEPLIYSFTALGQSIKHVLNRAGFGSEGYVISPEIMEALSKLEDGEEIEEEMRDTLLMLGYITEDGRLTTGGEWLIETYRLWHERQERETWSFAIEEEEIVLLKEIKDLLEKMETNPDITPNLKTLKHFIVDRRINELKEITKRYGRRLKEMPLKFQKILEQFKEVKEYEKWLNDNFDVRILLDSLESFNLIESSTDKKGKEIFVLTEFGEKVLADQEKNTRKITSTSVKSITMTRKTFSAPHIQWYEEARESNLLGPYEPTESGLFYAWLAENIERKPFISAYGKEIFHRIPARGYTIEELLSTAKDEEEKSKMEWAVHKLEAMHLIEILPDGNIVLTEAGEKIKKAIAGVPSGFGAPVTPLIYRVLKAISEVGSLYQKEKKIRIQNRKLKEAMKKTGLSEEVFDKMLEAARRAGYLGKNSITEAGMLLIEGVQLMNPSEKLGGYMDFYLDR